MRAVGIVAEYNPFHLGHKYQIDILKQNFDFDVVACVMSPSVVQRGTVSLFPQNVRVAAAIKAGVDLVISLPAPYAVLSAEGFATAGVEILGALGCIDTIAFGSECGNTQDIIMAKNAASGADFEKELAQNLARGMEFAKARANAVGKLNPKAQQILNSPNNILGVEYCKAISKLELQITPLALARQGADHDEEIKEGKNQSASALRELILNNKSEAFFNGVAKECVSIYSNAIKEGEILNLQRFDIALLSRLRQMNTADFAQIRGTNEGLENRLFDAVQKAGSAEQLYSLLKCKRYTHARMRRLALDAALGYKSDLPQSVPYLHVLGASENGIKLLQICKAFGAKPISESLSFLKKQNDNCEKIAEAHSNAENFASLCRDAVKPCGTAFTGFLIK